MDHTTGALERRARNPSAGIGREGSEGVVPSALGKGLIMEKQPRTGWELVGEG